MPWVSRNTRRYYYRSVRVGNSVRRVYVGAGPEAECAAAEDSARRDARAAQANADRAERTRLEAVDAMAQSLADWAQTLAHAALLLAGYHRHHRSTWRKTRHERSNAA